MLLLEMLAEGAASSAGLLALLAPVAPLSPVIHAEEGSPVRADSAEALLLAVGLAFLEMGAVAAVLALILEAVMLADRVAAFTQPLAVAAGVPLPLVLAVDGTAALPGCMGGKVTKPQ